MTPDKVEAALGVLSRIADDYHPNTDKEAPLALAEMREALTEALSVLTEALAESRRDAARYRWMRKKVCIIGTEHLSYPKAIFEFVNLPCPKHVAPRADAELDAAIDAAMKETP